MVSMATQKSVTQLLVEWRGGDGAALEALTPQVYEQLHGLALRCLRGERQNHTLQATALVHEAYERLVDVEIPWKDRAHFFALAARMMRRILVDYAKSKKRQKRGGGVAMVTLDEALVVAPETAPDLIELDQVLTRFAEIDERKSRVVELTYFGGLTYEETAEAMGMSPATVHRELRLAKAWLYRELGGSADA